MCGAGRLVAMGASHAAGWGGFAIGSVAAAGKGDGGSCVGGVAVCGAGALWAFVPAARRAAGWRARCSTGCAMFGAAALDQRLHSAAPTGPKGGEAGRWSWRRWVVVVRVQREAHN